ncbi:MAG: hypothetical protein ACK528_00930 [Alphaproteobacteria bacterium]|jgi:hypothetical protein
MSGLYGWLRRTWSSLAVVADMSEQSTATADESEGCQIYSDALDQLMLEYDQLCDRIDWNLDHLWECRKAKALAESVGTEDGRLQRHNVTQQSLNGAKLLLKTAANRVRQVVDEIEIVTQREQQ